MTPRRLLLTITEMLGKVDVRAEEPIIRRRDRTPTITVRGDIANGLQPPDVSSAITRIDCPRPAEPEIAVARHFAIGTLMHEPTEAQAAFASAVFVSAGQGR